MATAGARPIALQACPPPSPADLRAVVEARLAVLTPEDDGLLATAGREALFGPGKRVRPILAMLACGHAGGPVEAALDFGCAVEMVHAASLALDDLPCMDDAALRRGRPALHLSRGEDAAVLAAVALLNQATRVILEMSASAERRVAAVELLTRAVGFDGLAHGQMRDLRDGAAERDAAGLRRINDLKTGALFVAAVRGGGMLGDGGPETLSRLSVFGEAIGFAFQLVDDLIDATSSLQTAGKDVGQDRDMLTFVDLWGEGRVRAAVRQSLARAAEAIGPDEALTLYVLDLFKNADVGV